MTKVFVLTRQINDYNQEGEYFVAVFANWPTREQLIAHGVHEDYLDHVLAGGGRSSDMEDVWFHINKVILN